MAHFRFYSTTQHDNGAGGHNAVLVNASDEAAVRPAAQAARPDGESNVRARWGALEVADAAGAAFPNIAHVVWWPAAFRRTI